ncbi:2-hydroxymuconic semialdehyde dehydrogenase [Alkalilimnicola sp. S0819]|uniref:2-hydroxymuconic semialdehyde dehydrogenase n=1 Tax=Alkalilimnicola sp. S0819 TaxID=2613922 RepID=UPI001261791C|nr:2-hydroxymuconic semialdehyde dehydrogenase [Alkalilimnicola sp. S0819]KAB7623343.1 2-hydroxymuconic semialdehyde dehydrogenase [Alkalilimnicola sp. S0819]MPQ16882.1 2-hydroxymuconic semialdehyde dehydrogenase [Alkalilimnicola sp. S0819]
MKEVKHFINGEYVGSKSGKQFDNVNPANGQVFGKVHEAGRDEVNAAVAAAREALHGEWGRMSVEKRLSLVKKVAERINERFDEFLEAECLDTGKPASLASHVDIPRGAANFGFFADHVKNFPTESFFTDTPDGAGAVNYGVRKPRGVLAVIAPWNLPLLLMTWKVGPALACGNTVVVKPSEITPTTAALLGEVMNEVGIPKGVYNVVHGFGPDSAGAYLTEHPDVDGITFTGESRTGEVIMRAAAKGVRPVSLELGGKNPSLVFNDADMDAAIDGHLRSIFINCGQVCFNTERVYVQRDIHDEFVARLKAAVEQFRPGAWNDDSCNLGPLVSEEHQQKVLSYFKKAEEAGATVVTGGGVPEMPEELQGGFWVQPTIWTGLKETDAPACEEVFGPCVHIAPFDTEEEAVALANNTRYGLGASVWTRDVSRAHRMGQVLDVGMLWVNSWFLRDLRTSFGGNGASGVGREGGVHGLEFYSELRNVCIKL